MKGRYWRHSGHWPELGRSRMTRALGILPESILRHNDLQNGFHRSSLPMLLSERAVLLSAPSFFSFISSSTRGVGPCGTSGDPACTPGGPPADGDGNKAD